MYREGGKACELTPEQLGEDRGGGCVNWNIFYTNCTAGPHNPHHGAVSFDNIGKTAGRFFVFLFSMSGLAWVAIFVVISLEGWTDVMYLIQDVHSFYNFVYFVVLIIVKSHHH